MQKDFYLAKIALTISASGRINRDDIDPELLNLNSVKDRVDLLNVILISHKKRFVKCFTSEQQDSEQNLLISNYCTIFDENDKSFIDIKFVVSIFNLLVCDNLKSTRFREVCIQLIDVAQQCAIQEIINAVLSKLVKIIVQLGLYGDEPFDFILNRCIDLIDCKLKPLDLNFTFLE